MNNRHSISAVAIMGFALLALGSGKSKTEGAGSGTSTEAKPAAVAKAAEIQAPAGKIGDLVKFDDSEWTVLDAKEMGQTLKSNNQFQENAKTDGKFVYVHFKVKNLGDKEERIMDHPKVVDAKGREFSDYDQATFYLAKNVKTMSMEALPSSMNKEFGAIYEVPADAAGISFQARALAAMGDKKLVALGF